MFICAICGSHHLQLEINLPQISQITTDLFFRLRITSFPSARNISVHLCYLWETPPHSTSVCICAICWRHFRIPHPCASAISVGDSFACCNKRCYPMTIFVFLMLNTMSPAHNKIFGAKFLSFEQFGITCLYTACYAVFLTKRREIRLANEPFYAAIEPLLHYNTAAVVIQ